jgi:hypothetical protein
MPNIKEKARAIKTKAKAIVGAKVKSAGTLAKQEARGISVNARQRVADMQDDNTLGYVKRQDRASARRAERVKRITERNSTGRVIYETGEMLDRRKRVAREQIRETLSPNTFKNKTKREINATIDRHRKDIASRPLNDQQMRKRNDKLQRGAVIGPSGPGAGTGSGVCDAEGLSSKRHERWQQGHLQAKTIQELFSILKGNGDKEADDEVYQKII